MYFFKKPMSSSKSIIISSLFAFTIYALSLNIAFASVVPARTLRTQPDLQRGLVGHWTFDGKDMGPNVRDVSGQGNNGTVVNLATTSVIGRIGQALLFPGGTNYINARSATVLDNISSFSVSAWVYATTTGTIADKRGAGKGWFFRVWTSNTLRFFVEHTGTDLDVISSSNKLTFNKWNHALVTYDGSTLASNVHIYINGVETTYGTQTNGTLIRESDAGENMLLGGRPTPVANSIFGGKMDDVRVYSRILSANEITKLYKLGATSHINVTLPTQPDLQNGLVGHWTFDGKDMGPNVRDRSGSGNHGNLILSTTGNTVTTTRPGRIGQAVTLDGVNDRVIVKNSSSIQQDAQTWTIWVKPTTMSASVFDILAKIETAYSSAVLFYLTSSVTRVYVNTGSPPTIAVDALALNKWSFLSLVIDGVGNVYLYINGSLVGSGTYTGSASNTGDLFIGSETASTRFTNGNIDDVRIYSRALSATEVARLYKLGATTHVNAAIPTQPDLQRGLVGHWTFDGKDMGPNVRDKSGSGNHGNLILSTTGNTVTTTVAGRLGQALKFDGSDDYVTGGDIASLEFTGDMAVSAWIRTDVAQSNKGIVGKWISSPSDAGWLMFAFSTSQITFQVDGTGNRATVAITDKKWVHAVGIRSGTNIYLYIDGVLAATDTGTTLSTSGTAALQVGAYSSSNFFDGQIDDVRIYNRALSAGEVNKLYQMGR